MHQNIVPVIGGSDSLDEQIQREFPAPGLSKALNTVNCSVMVDRARVPGEYISDRRCASGATAVRHHATLFSRADDSNRAMSSAYPVDSLGEVDWYPVIWFAVLGEDPVLIGGGAVKA